MAAHGTIEINGIVFGEWTAQRRQTHNKVNTYDCTVVVRNQVGTLMGSSFEVEHTYAEGLTALAALVLAEHEKHAQPVRKGYQDE